MKSLVYKITGVHGYDPEWRKRLELFMSECPLPAFVRFLQKGYITEYIDGVDLWGDTPFEFGGNTTPFELSDAQKENVLALLKDVVRAAYKTEVYLGEFTRRNIMLRGDTPYLIDYDHLYEGKVMEPSSAAGYQELLDFLEVEYDFKSHGNIEKLYNALA